MTKTEFIKKIKATRFTVEFQAHKKRITISPEATRLAPGFVCHYTPAVFDSKTDTPWTQANAESIGDQIREYRKIWWKEFAEYKARVKKNPAYKEAVRKQEFLNLCICAGLIETSDNPFDRGDHFSIHIIEFVWRKKDLAKYQASGAMLGLARQTRKRVYAQSSDWRFSERTDTFVVGVNENGNPFLHQVPNHVASLQEAWVWIWREAQIIARQGDIGIAPSTLKHKEGEENDIAVGGGHSRHRFIGESYQNGSLHVRSGFLVHTAGQHPPVYLDGSCWRRIVVARRSEVGMSSRD